MTGLLLRAVLIWAAILVVAIINGAFRQGVLIPRFGELTGHVLSTVMLSAAVVFVAWLTLGWIAPGHTGDLWTVGIVWLLLTVVFEFAGGHFLFGRPWQVLLADYRIQEGRIWVLVLIATLVAPFVAWRLRGM